MLCVTLYFSGADFCQVSCHAWKGSASFGNPDTALSATRDSQRRVDVSSRGLKNASFLVFVSHCASSRQMLFLFARDKLGLKGMGNIQPAGHCKRNICSASMGELKRTRIYLSWCELVCKNPIYCLISVIPLWFPIDNHSERCFYTMMLLHRVPRHNITDERATVITHTLMSAFTPYTRTWEGWGASSQRAICIWTASRRQSPRRRSCDVWGDEAHTCRKAERKRKEGASSTYVCAYIYVYAICSCTSLAELHTLWLAYKQEQVCVCKVSIISCVRTTWTPPGVRTNAWYWCVLNYFPKQLFRVSWEHVHVHT